MKIKYMLLFFALLFTFISLSNYSYGWLKHDMREINEVNIDYINNDLYISDKNIKFDVYNYNNGSFILNNNILFDFILPGEARTIKVDIKCNDYNGSYISISLNNIKFFNYQFLEYNYINNNYVFEDIILDHITVTISKYTNYYDPYRDMVKLNNNITNIELINSYFNIQLDLFNDIYIENTKSNELISLYISFIIDENIPRDYEDTYIELGTIEIHES